MSKRVFLHMARQEVAYKNQSVAILLDYCAMRRTLLRSHGSQPRQRPLQLLLKAAHIWPEV
jgi:hypothetical protein